MFILVSNITDLVDKLTDSLKLLWEWDMTWLWWLVLTNKVWTSPTLSFSIIEMMFFTSLSLRKISLVEPHFNINASKEEPAKINVLKTWVIFFRLLFASSDHPRISNISKALHCSQSFSRLGPSYLKAAAFLTRELRIYKISAWTAPQSDWR